MHAIFIIPHFLEQINRQNTQIVTSRIVQNDEILSFVQNAQKQVRKERAFRHFDEIKLAFCRKHDLNFVKFCLLTKNFGIFTRSNHQNL